MLAKAPNVLIQTNSPQLQYEKRMNSSVELECACWCKRFSCRPWNTIKIGIC